MATPGSGSFSLTRNWRIRHTLWRAGRFVTSPSQLHSRGAMGQHEMVMRTIHCAGVRTRAPRLRGAALAVGIALLCLLPPREASAESAACSSSPGPRQLDFWLGVWTVTYPAASGRSRSEVSLDLDQCLLIERWNDGGGHRGQNMLAYSLDDQRWYGMFVDNEGRVHIFDGKVVSETAEFHGAGREHNEQAAIDRIRLVRIDADHVRQVWEKSRDNGTSWTTAFRGDYTRQKP